MLQVRKLRFCGISAIFFQCCFMSETQALMTVSDFWVFFLGIIFWKGALFFNEGAPHEGASALMGFFSFRQKKN